MISTIGTVKGTAWKLVFVEDDPVLKKGYYYRSAGDPPAYVSAEKHSLTQDVHFHITICLVARIPIDHDPADFITELNYWFESGTEAKIIDTEMIDYEVIEP